MCGLKSNLMELQVCQQHIVKVDVAIKNRIAEMKLVILWV